VLIMRREVWESSLLLAFAFSGAMGYSFKEFILYQSHIFSSIWSGVKAEYFVVKENTSWIIEDGKHIDFLLDLWCGESLIQSLHLQPSQINSFHLTFSIISKAIIILEYPCRGNPVSSKSEITCFSSNHSYSMSRR
jgi:hypothetical protein